MRVLSALNLFKNVYHLIQAHVKRIVNIGELAQLEAQLACRTFVKIIISLVLFIILLGSLWLGLLAALYLFLLSYQFLPLHAMLITIAVNCSIMIAVCIYVVIIKKDLFFPATRKQIFNSTDKQIVKRR